MKVLTVTETLKSIQKNLIPYGPDKRARFVESACAALAESRMGPGASDDMFMLDDFAPELTAFSYLDLYDFIVPNSSAVWYDVRPVEPVGVGDPVRIMLFRPEWSLAVVCPPDIRLAAPT